MVGAVFDSFMSESDKESSSGVWGFVNILGACAIVTTVLVAPMIVRSRSRCCGNSCINNLRQIDGAVQQWALEQKKEIGDKVTMSDITPYLKNPITCPQKGVYIVGPTVSNIPICSVAGHALPP